MDKSKPRRNHMGSSNMRRIPSLPERSDQENSSHPLQSTKSHQILSPFHSNPLKGNRVGCTWVYVSILLHHTQRQCHQAVYHSDNRHRSQQSQSNRQDRNGNWVEKIESIFEIRVNKQRIVWSIQK